MLITRIELENIKSYRQVAVDFRRGTTAISGANGAGKTTLVEAIGFALFGYLPYKQEQFVREGEKNGKVVVHLVGGDDRPYTVERQCGTGSRWQVYDEEADMRLEQRADVQDKLHELFGIDRERSLDALFRDALGVPQGTFTSIFLETGAKRKQTFDALLQIEDYQVAAKYLLGSQNHYKEQLQTQRSTIERLQYETRELDGWREQLQSKRLEDQENKAKNIQLSELLTTHEQRKTFLDQQAERVRDLNTRYEHARSDYSFADQRLQDLQRSFQKAYEAQQIVTDQQSAYDQHQQATITLRDLRQQANARDALRQQHGKTSSTEIQINERIANHQNRLQEVERARRRIAELAPLVEQQLELERQRDEARQQRQRYLEVCASGQQSKDKHDAATHEQEQCQRKITAIQPLVPIAQLLETRRETHTRLLLQASKRNEKQRQLKDKQAALREKQRELEPAADLLRRAENNVRQIEEHRLEAEEMPELEQELQTLNAQRNRLEGNIDGYARSRAQSAGGQCPLLHESCLNIRQKGIVSLESYFEGLLTEEKGKIESIQVQQRTLTRRKDQIQKYADALTRWSDYLERRDERAENMQRIQREMTRLEQEVATLTQELADIDQVEQQFKQAEIELQASKQADTEVRALDGLNRQLEHVQKQLAQLETDITNLRQEASQLQGSGARLKQLETDLTDLNDPRSESRAKQDTLAKEAQYQQQLQQEELRLQDIQQQLQSLDTQLTAYASLDSEIARQELLVQQNQSGYHRYLQHQNEALGLPERQQAFQRQQTVTTEAREKLQAVQQEFEQAQAAFNRQDLEELGLTIERVRYEQVQLIEQMKTLQLEMNRLEQQIAAAEVLLAELEVAQKEYQTLDDLHKMMGQFRELIKDAAPHVLKAMLSDISAEANRIFGEIMGDRRAQLAWRNDYEVILRQQGVDRSFAQLSGGEQMSAALAIRLALLKKLSSLNIAFFDEPTQNMDELRRMNLAEQIRRVRGFDQLIVISHDDTFEQGLDSLVRLNKVHGETQLLDDEDSLPQANPGQGWADTEANQTLLQPTN
ncbi:hypothetical protein KDW_23530 [Dictyobacter vulcani]|uniref:Nuclease SbcCD subunit C n=1 Tax=Dictyobacter vulcani TaxID=2607529 RepID=A0A5J4KPB0_9CHLR|nr:SMC family ATPase [Dictyobacter vulcani]GER88191.1 hypothetical protein KDW_23530 [Dictyobacter vulcani]